MERKALSGLIVVVSQARTNTPLTDFTQCPWASEMNGVNTEECRSVHFESEPYETKLSELDLETSAHRELLNLPGMQVGGERCIGERARDDVYSVPTEARWRQNSSDGRSSRLYVHKHLLGLGRVSGYLVFSNGTIHPALSDCYHRRVQVRIRRRDHRTRS